MNFHDGVCAWDLISSTRRRSISETHRASQRNLAHRISRRRLIQPKQRDQHQDGSNLLFRRNVVIEDDWEQYYPYLTVSFLDQHDTVLAADTYGRIDVVRLPRYCAPCEEGEHASPSRMLGQQLADRVELNQSLHYEGTFVKLKSLQGGHAFAAGMPSGHFQVFGTEHASTWGKRHLGSTVGLAGTENISRKEKKDFVRHAWSIEGPPRRYARDYTVPKLSLRRMAQNGIGQPMAVPMVEIDGWSTLGNAHYELKDKIENCNMWDFRETPSAMLAAHVDRYRDCFSLRVMDDRVKQKPNRSAMCIDMSTRDWLDLSTKDTFVDIQENVTAICFSSDHCIATSHQRTLNDGVHTSSSIKWWDMRMIRHDRAKPIETVVPSFPLNQTYCMEPCSEFDPIGTANYAKNDGIPVFIRGLRPSAEGIGTLLVTLTSHSKSNPGVEHVLIDSTRHCAMQKVRTNKTPASHPLAITQNHDFLASLSDKDEDSCGQSIKLYDLSRTSLRQTKDKCPRREKSTTSRKRSSSDLLDEGEKPDPRLKGVIPANITDRHGMRSGLSCMAFNDTGSALVCGSDDGDLFLWRGG